MKILVLGAGGMLGHKLYQTLNQNFDDVWGHFRKDKTAYQEHSFYNFDKIIDNLDVTHTNQLLAKLSMINPDVICNCIGITTRKMQNCDFDKLMAINSRLPHVIGEWCQLNNSRLIHFSTDCVFNGEQEEAYTEDCLTDADDLYGRSKALGEVTGPNLLTLRSSIVGRELESHTELIEWAISQAGQSIQGFSEVYYSGVTTNYMAKTVCNLIQNFKNLSGIYQIASPVISKYNLLKTLNKSFNLGLKITENNDYKSNKSLNGSKFEQATGLVTPDWDAMINEVYLDSKDTKEKEKAA